jgi:hypothetical protein
VLEIITINRRKIGEHPRDHGNFSREKIFVIDDGRQ